MELATPEVGVRGRRDGVVAVDGRRVVGGLVVIAQTRGGVRGHSGGVKLQTVLSEVGIHTGGLKGNVPHKILEKNKPTFLNKKATRKYIMTQLSLHRVETSEATQTFIEGLLLPVN